MVLRSDSASLALAAPGTPLREGLDRILQSKMGALLVVGDGPEVLGICSGGFLLDAEYSPQRLSELAKMDGAIILAADASRIARANVHLVPDSTIPTTETGTRHRTAERVARSLDVPVVSVSEQMSSITVYRGDMKYPLEPVARLLDRASQALQTLGRYRSRLEVEAAMLSRHEIDDLVTIRDVAVVLQRFEMLRRIADEISLTILQLGTEGRLARLQLDELMAGVEREAALVQRDYGRFRRAKDGRDGARPGSLAALPTDELLELESVARAAGVVEPSAQAPLSVHVRPCGYRLLNRVPRLSDAVIDHVVGHFGTLGKVLDASVHDLVGVEGVGEVRARAIRDGLGRVVEAVTAESAAI